MSQLVQVLHDVVLSPSRPFFLTISRRRSVVFGKADKFSDFTDKI
jgi:hypothetical protein